MFTENDEASPPLLVGQVEQVHGQPRAPSPSGDSVPLVSVVVPCLGQLEYTRPCVLSLLRHSRRPCELIFLDIASLDGTREFLAGVRAAAPARIEVIRAAAEADFRDAWAEALGRAGGEFIAWLTNDTIVPEGWLQQLVALCRGHELLGMVGPMSNYAPGPQRVPEVPYRLGAKASKQPAGDDPPQRDFLDIETVARFAREWRERHKGQWFEADRLGGFCLLLKRSILHDLPFLDEQSARGLFDADALSWRVRQAGYHLACCRDLFIHHFGSRLAATGGGN